MAISASELICFLPIISAQLLLGLPSCVSWWPPTTESISTTASLYLHLLQRNLLVPGSSIRLKKTQSKVDIWIFLLYEQMERICLVWPVKNPSIVFPMDNCPRRKGFPSWLPLSPPPSSCALCLWLLIFFTSHQLSLPLDILHGLCVVWQWQHHLHHHLSGAVMLCSDCPLHRPSITPFLTHTLWILLLLFHSDQTPTKGAGSKGKELILYPHLFFLVSGFLFLSPHCPSFHHRFYVLTWPDLIFQFTLRGSSSVPFLVLTDFISSGVFFTF